MVARQKIYEYPTVNNQRITDTTKLLLIEVNNVLIARKRY
jgi:hypothetical protein